MLCSVVSLICEVLIQDWEQMAASSKLHRVVQPSSFPRTTARCSSAQGSIVAAFQDPCQGPGFTVRAASLRIASRVLNWGFENLAEETMWRGHGDYTGRQRPSPKPTSVYAHEISHWTGIVLDLLEQPPTECHWVTSADIMQNRKISWPHDHKIIYAHCWKILNLW